MDQKTFANDFKENIKKNENQHLFGYLVTVLPSVILFNVEKFTTNDFPKIDNRVKVLSNIRIDLSSLKEYLIELDQNPDCKSVKIDIILSELITFLFQYW